MCREKQDSVARRKVSVVLPQRTKYQGSLWQSRFKKNTFIFFRMASVVSKSTRISLCLLSVQIFQHQTQTGQVGIALLDVYIAVSDTFALTIICFSAS